MKLGYFGYLALLGGLAFLILFIADRQEKLGEDRLSVYKIPHSALDADLQLAYRTLAGNSASAKCPKKGNC